MATSKPLDLPISSFAKPPSSHVRPQHNDKEFKYRGTLFRPVSAQTNSSQNRTQINISFHDRSAKDESDALSSVEQKQSHVHSNQIRTLQIKPRRIQSAKGRLERLQDTNACYSSRTSEHPVLRDNKTSETCDKKASVLNLNDLVNIPNKEEAELTLHANIVHRTTNELNHKQNFRPSSAKCTVGCPVSTAEPVEKNPTSADNVLKPAVYGLKLGRQVFGNESHILEAWAKTEKDYPFKLKEKEEGNLEMKRETTASEKRNLPQTLHPLQRWLCHNTHSGVTGIDSDNCLVFLSRDYTAHELPAVPPPQNLVEDLPYTCLVATPREKHPKKYHHPFFEHDTKSLEWKCSHTKAFDPNAHGDISFLLSPPQRRNPQAIRLEIAELENLMQGIGSLNSDCSFVKFQAEITRAQAQARELILPDSSSENEQPADLFGLLKFYKEHDKAMAIIRERRRICLQELQQLEEGNTK
ncbi:glutamate receptor delta-1 subunit [Plakobranchus ocellatus]|uniref:Glutamate receptor delta-1 subunit n=1 Tax=Plakobranchus ocellatus TaxID=259542 RepID=A0AAV3Z4X3_9GAST|nr:glutamate receptor delta-1 subunit [Plakobranchus ocellatus]